MRLSKRGTVPDEATALASLRRQDASLQSSRRALASLQSSITGIYRAEDEQQGQQKVFSIGSRQGFG